MDVFTLVFAILVCARANIADALDFENVTSCSLLETLQANSSTANRACICPSNKICVRKCCPLDKVMVPLINGTTCVHSNESHHFWDYTAFGEFKEWTNLSTLQDVHVIYGFPCKTRYFLNPQENENDSYTLLKDGTLVVENASESQFCVDYAENMKIIIPLICDEMLSEENLSMLEKNKSTVEKIERYVKIYGLLLSVVFLILTFFVYAVVPSLQNLHGKNLLCHVLALIIGYSGLFAVSGHIRLDPIVCVVSAFIVQFSFLASFFWLNIMCFDLWWTFSGYRSFNGSPKERDFKKFLVYCLYAWGCPSLIVAATVFVEFYPNLPNNFIRPEFGKTKCFFETNQAIFIYFYSFISIIVFSNLCMFISTTFILKKHEKEAKVFKRSGSRRHLDHDKQRFNLYLKLFIVMGVNWIMEVISFYVPGPASLWLITDIGNTLQGVLIFLIFVCKRRVLILLNKRLCPNHLLLNRPKKNASTATSVSSLASVRHGTGAQSKVSNKIQLDRLKNGGSKLEFSV